MTETRIRDIDFWRGAVLIAILIDHIPGNPLENWTPRNFGLSDSAEAFVFLSGLSVGLIYLPRAFKYGLEPVAGGMSEARAQTLWRAYRAVARCARGFRRGLLGERRAGLDPGAWSRFRLRLAREWALGPCPAQPSTRLFQYPAVVYRFDAVGAGCGRARVAQPAIGVDGFRWPLRSRARFRPQSAELARAGILVLQSSRLATRVHAGRRGRDCVARRFPAASSMAGRVERRDGGWRGVDRDQRGRLGAWPARHGDRASRHRQAGSWARAPHPFCRIGLSDRRGHRVRAIHRANGQGRLRQCGSKSWPQQSAGFRRRFVLQRLQPSRTGGRFTSYVCRG